MAPRRCKYVEYDHVGDNWVIRPVWNHGLTLVEARIEITAPDDPKVQVHVETVATAIDQMIDVAAGIASTKLSLAGDAKLRMGAAALSGEGEIKVS